MAYSYMKDERVEVKPIRDCVNIYRKMTMDFCEIE